MHTRTPLAVVVALVAGFALPALSADSAARSDGPGAGKELFQARCGGCHLVGGGGTAMLAKRLGKEKSLLEERKDLLPLYIQTVVRRGVGSMPWFTRVELPDVELNAIADYLSPPAQTKESD
jgi:mono/diheme cytochrome c family protein